MRHIVISLKQATLRRQHISQQFNELNISFEYFDAINRHKAIKICKNYGFDYEGKLTLGELACLLSHISVWKEAIDKNESHIAVFEDDAIISPRYRRFFDNELEKIKHQCPVIKLETMKYRVMLGEVLLSYKDTKLQKILSHHVGAAGYIIKTEVAQEIINEISKVGVIKPIDLYLFDNISIKDRPIFQVVPAMVIQDDILNKNNAKLVSSLEEERREYYHATITPFVATKNEGFKKIKREISRLINQINPLNWKDNYKNWCFKRLSTIIDYE